MHIVGLVAELPGGSSSECESRAVVTKNGLVPVDDLGAAGELPALSARLEVAARQEGVGKRVEEAQEGMNRLVAAAEQRAVVRSRRCEADAAASAHKCRATARADAERSSVKSPQTLMFRPLPLSDRSARSLSRARVTGIPLPG